MEKEKFVTTLQQIKTIVDEALAEVGPDARERTRSGGRRTEPKRKATEISFNTNILAFMNKYARGLKGPQKFALLLARLVKGNVSQQVPRAEMERHWNKMKVVLGGKSNPAHANRAKAKGWVDSPKHGVYTLSSSWKEALK